MYRLAIFTLFLNAVNIISGFLYILILQIQNELPHKSPHIMLSQSRLEAIVSCTTTLKAMHLGLRTKTHEDLRDPSRLHRQYPPLSILYIVYSRGNAVRKREIQETGQVNEASDLANAFSDLTDRQNRM
jgi:hypothetical protein